MSTRTVAACPHGGTAASLAWGLAALYVIAAAVAIWMDIQVYRELAPGGVGTMAAVAQRGFFLGPFVLFPIVGAAIVARRSRNAVGWLMLVAASALALAGVAAAYAALTLGGSSGSPSFLGLIAKWIEMPSMFLGLVTGLVVVPLVFPTGRPLSRRWWLVTWGAAAVVVLAIAESVLAPRLTGSLDAVTMQRSIEIYDVANPLGVAAAAGLTDAISTVQTLLLMVLSVTVATGVGIRFRRSRGIERQQMKWFLSAVGVVAVTMATILVTKAVPVITSPTWLWGGVVLAGFLGYPAAVGMAVLRYRLYDIDRIISRTVSYGLVVAVLGGVYLAGVVGLGAAVTAVTAQQDSDLVVAVSTLAAAALFGPVRTRVQTAVDRRFNRTGYEARRAVEAFTREVRDEVDLDRLRRRAAETAAVATQPSHVSVWLTDAGE